MNAYQKKKVLKYKAEYQLNAFFGFHKHNITSDDIKNRIQESLGSVFTVNLQNDENGYKLTVQCSVDSSTNEIIKRITKGIKGTDYRIADFEENPKGTWTCIITDIVDPIRDDPFGAW